MGGWKILKIIVDLYYSISRKTVILKALKAKTGQLLKGIATACR